MATIFISYRHVEPDESVARYLTRYLSNLEHEVFFDREALNQQVEHCLIDISTELRPRADQPLPGLRRDVRRSPKHLLHRDLTDRGAREVLTSQSALTASSSAITLCPPSRLDIRR